MPIEVTCPDCSRRLRVPDKVAGKRVKCPKCGGVIRVPELEAAAEPAEVQPVAEEPSPTDAANQNWWMKTEDGEQYGPIPKPELDEWHAEGRVTADSQLLPDGADQWMWASDVYPDLEASSVSDAVPPAITPAPPTPAGPVVEPTSPPTADAGPGVFVFAAEDTKASARVRGGRRVRKVVKRKAPAATAAPAAPVSMVGAGELSDKSKVVAGLLGLFLGCYGVHRFYLGYTGLGLCMLFTCGGCGIWSFIDSILIFAGGVSDPQGRPLR